MALYNLIALDLDGTTLNNRHELSTRTIGLLRKICSDGKAVICIATGRGVSSILSYLQILNLSQPITPFVSYNGAMGMLYHSQTQHLEAIATNPLPEESSRILINFATRLGLVVQYYDGMTGDVQAVPSTDEHRQLLARYAALTGAEQTILTSYEEAIARSPSAKLLIMTNDADALIAQAKESLPHNMFHIIRGSPAPFFVEFLHPDVNKGSCLEQLCNHMKIPLQHVVAFGDGDNDKEMLKLAGIGIAMANAQPAAKNAADLVLQWTNDEDGVARKLEELFYPST